MTRVAYDMSSFMQTALRGGKDDENGYEVEHEGKKVWINSHYHGYDKCIDYMLDVLKEFGCKPMNAILVFEGMNQKARRQMIDPSYKGNRGKSPQAYYDEMGTLKVRLLQAWRDVGAIAVEQDIAEGDDTLAWLAQNSEEDLVVATYDNDLAALCGTNAYGAKITTWIGDVKGGQGLIDVNKFGAFDYHLIPTYKALVGDSSDNIKGILGFGPKAFEEFCSKYGYDGLAELQAMLLAGRLHPDLEAMDCKVVKKIVENQKDMFRCFELARLRPEWVDTMKNPLRWMPGKIRPVQQGDDPRLKPFLGRIKLITADNFEQAVEWARPHIEASVEVALDIEGSDADESDDWLEAQRSKGKAPGVDTFGSTLTGLGLTFGDNTQYTFYISVDHADTNNVESEKVRQFIASIPRHIPIVIQNTMYELPVLFNEWGAEQMTNGCHGFLPNVLDSLFEGSYVNENMELGLKERSRFYLGYTQETYDEVTTLTDKPEDLPRGGKLLRTNYLTETYETGKMVEDTSVGVINEDGSIPMIPEVKTRVVERETGEFETDYKGDLVLKKGKPVPIKEPVVDTVTRQYKMRELSARHVLGYGADDTICTIALHNFYKLHMQLEHHWQVYLDVEIGAAYQHAKNFVDGVPMSQEELNRQIAEDDKIFAGAWSTLRAYLMKKGWAGTEPPVYTRDITVAQVKEAYQIVTGEPLDTAIRTMSKLVTFIREVKDQPILAALLERMTAPLEPDSEITAEEAAKAGEGEDIIRMREKAFTDYVRSKFSGEPEFNDGSTPQMCRLLYEVMELPIRVRNKPTDIMRAKGINEGNPKADALAIAYALRDAEGDDEKVEVLKALQLMSMVGTRRSLYYEKYPHFPHWKDGKIHSQHKQCSTNTRRGASAKPNLQQLPKHPKMEGYAAAFRRVIVPHKPGAVVVSIDFDAQELRIIAERSQDPTALSMFVGDKLTKPHALTGLGIAMKLKPEILWTYDMFMQIHKDDQHELHKFVKECYRLGKKLNFVAEYGAMAPKVAATLMVDEDEAQTFLDGREDMFPRVKEWKQEVIAFAKKHGYVLTMKGARRHLRDALMSDDRFEASKAERQAVNFEVQGPSAEQTKEAEGRMWARGLFFRYDAVCYGPIHDELVMSVMIEDLVEFLPEAHACMAVQYAGMKVPCLGSISFGANFFDQIEIGTEPTPEAIEEGLRKLRGEVELAEAA
jgi:5'-3' exonuclease